MSTGNFNLFKDDHWTVFKCRLIMLDLWFIIYQSKNKLNKIDFSCLCYEDLDKCTHPFCEILFALSLSCQQVIFLDKKCNYSTKSALKWKAHLTTQKRTLQ